MNETITPHFHYHIILLKKIIGDFMKNKFFIAILTFLMLFSSISVYAESSEPELQAQNAILMDAQTGTVLYEKNADEKAYPASITKLMTVLLGLENGNLSDVITMSHDAIYSIEPGSSHISLLEGEEVTLEQLLYAIMLRSANEAANAVAEYVDGSMDAFAVHMTERAKELGCTNTNFLNANGLHDENHYTTAHDMALIMQELLKHEEFLTIASSVYYEIGPTNMQTETRYLHGQNQLMRSNSTYYRDYVIAGKTGYTDQARNTLVSAATQNGTTLIAVTMGCNGAEHYTDSIALYEYGFANFKTATLMTQEQTAQTVSVTETIDNDTTEKGKVQAIAMDDIAVTVPIDTDVSVYQTSVTCNDTASAPVAAGDELGKITVTDGDGNTVYTTSLFANTDVAASTAEEIAVMKKEAQITLLKEIIFGAALAVLGFLILLCITRTIGKYQYKKRRKQRRHRQRNHMAASSRNPKS